MKSQKTLYILIAVFCVFALIAGIYAQFIEGGTKTPSTGEQGDSTATKQDSQAIKEEFNNLFTNTVNLNGADITGIQKNKLEKEIVYSAYDKVESTDAYEVNIHVPIVNIKNQVVNSFNNITNAIFVNKANEVLTKTDTTTKTIYSIDYVAYVNDDILSVIIRSTLKEGNSAQRVMIQTYNYNLKTQTQVSLNDIITKKALNKDDVNAKIKSVIQEADNEAKKIENMGYTTDFSRDLTSTMYTVENSGTFFLGEEQKLYVIYAYGNQNFTSEMDIVLL